MLTCTVSGFAQKNEASPAATVIELLPGVMSAFGAPRGHLWVNASSPSRRTDMTVSGKFNVIAIAAVLASGAGVAAASRLRRTHSEPLAEPGAGPAESKALTFLRDHVDDWALFGTGATLDDYVLDDDGAPISFRVRQRHIYRYPSYRLSKVAVLLSEVLTDGHQWTVAVDPLEGTASVERRGVFGKAAA